MLSVAVYYLVFGVMLDVSPRAGGYGNLAGLGEMLDVVLAIEERAIVFTQYSEMVSLLQSYLRETLDRDMLFLHGGTALCERELLLADL